MNMQTLLNSTDAVKFANYTKSLYERGMKLEDEPVNDSDYRNWLLGEFIENKKFSAHLELKKDELRKESWTKAVKIGEDMLSMIKNSIAVNREDLNYSSRDFDHEALKLVDAHDQSSVYKFEEILRCQREAILLINDHSIPQDRKEFKVLELVGKSLELVKQL